MSADYPKPSSARSPEMRAAAALERIAEYMAAFAVEPPTPWREAFGDPATETAASDGKPSISVHATISGSDALESIIAKLDYMTDWRRLTRERDEARRERDKIAWAHANQRETIERYQRELAPLSWSPEPPKVEGLYLYKSTSPIVGWVGASTYSKATIETAKWQPDLLWAGPLSIAPLQAPGAGGEA